MVSRRTGGQLLALPSTQQRPIYHALRQHGGFHATRRTGTPPRAAPAGERGAGVPLAPEGELALCILLFILFLALSWGCLVLWDEVFINTSDTAADTVHAVLTGGGRMAVYSAFLAVTALCIGKAIVIMAKFFARRRARP